MPAMSLTVFLFCWHGFDYRPVPGTRASEVTPTDQQVLGIEVVSHIRCSLLLSVHRKGRLPSTCIGLCRTALARKECYPLPEQLQELVIGVGYCGSCQQGWAHSCCVADRHCPGCLHSASHFSTWLELSVKQPCCRGSLPV